MASAVAELGALLTSMLELAPPGVSKTKITAITTLCNANIQSESVLIQKVYTHFKKAPANKKLGVLYVVDSVTRQWIEQARKAGQVMGASAADGTFAAGANHVTELLPALMQDIIAVAPEDQKTKIKKLIDIWERGNTFPANMVNGFKAKLEAPTANVPKSTTPTGSPPRNVTSFTAPGAAPPAQDTSAILANLQALASKTNGSATGPLGNLPPGSSSNVSYPQTAFPQQNVPSVNPAASMPPSYQAVGAPTPINNGMYSYGNAPAVPNFGYPGGGQQPAPPQQMPAGIMGQQQGNAGGMPDNLQQQLQILAALKQQGIPENQWPALLSVLMNNSAAQAALAGNLPAPTDIGNGQVDTSRDRNGGFNNQYVRSPPGRRDRSRSRSPGRWDRRRDDSPRGGRRRNSPVYGEYSGSKPEDRGGDHDRRGGRGGGRGNNYRQRSPQRRKSPSPPGHDLKLPPPGPKLIERDPSLPKGHIKVFSRTLFVGGVTRNDEDALRSIFQAFGRVQTCIVNADKRHAFVKMISREEALRAKQGMENFRHPDMQLRTRWGVGFGPRDCSDYQTGVSIIPIERLTDADRKWLLTAEYGGTGGKSIEEYMAVEEPDIEIGAGVSSKAISRRMQTDKSGMHGPRSTRDGPPGGSGSDGGGGSGGGRFRDRRDRDRNGPPGGISSANSAPLGSGAGHVGANAGTPPTVPSFNFNLFGNMAGGAGRGMPQGFPMPGQPGGPGA